MYYLFATFNRDTFARTLAYNKAQGRDVCFAINNDTGLHFIILPKQLARLKRRKLYLEGLVLRPSLADEMARINSLKP